MTPLDAAWLAAHPLPQPADDTDKNARGRVLAVGGSERVPGALRLTGEAALRAGAGKVQLATVERAALQLGLLVPEAAVIALPAGDGGELAAECGERAAAMLDRCDALVLGPGTGADCPAAALLRPLLAEPRESLTLLLDAAMLAAAPRLRDMIRAHRGRIVLTPHPGEMARLMECDAAQVADDPDGIARAAADRFDATVLLKGQQTRIATPGQETLLYPGGGAGLATGGSGDVLAGIVGGLLARGAAPHIAAGWGVWLHGEAGRRLAERIGPIGFLGRELAAEVPALMAAATAS